MSDELLPIEYNERTKEQETLWDKRGDRDLCKRCGGSDWDNYSWETACEEWLENGDCDYYDEYPIGQSCNDCGFQDDGEGLVWIGETRQERLDRWAREGLTVVKIPKPPMTPLVSWEMTE